MANRPCIPFLVLALLPAIGHFAQAEPGKGALKTKTLDLGGGVKLDLVLIPAGSFTMGSDKSRDKHADDDETPAHKVTISKDFYMGKYTVTVGQFKRFLADSGLKSEAEQDGDGGWGWNDGDGDGVARKPEFNWSNPGFAQGPDHPVVIVTWNDAQEFCKWLSKKTGEKVRLPYEAEWEYSCRAGTKTIYLNGDDPEGLAKIANVADASFKKKRPGATWAIAADDGYACTAPVGQFRPNDFGLYDMHGNVWQWCQDGPRTYADKSEVDPVGPMGADEFRVLRGGSFCIYPRNCHAAYRNFVDPSFRIFSFGFRVVVLR